jgi:hypothetical protein
MLLEGGLELCQQDEQRMSRELAQGLAQDKQLIKERHELQQRLKLEQLIRAEHPPDTPMKVELLRYLPAPLAAQNWRQHFNADDEVWSGRLASRLAGVTHIKGTKEYLSPWYVRKTPAPTTPNAHDRGCPKRAWEKRTEEWRLAVRDHALASNDEQLQELWQAGWDSL